MKPKVALILAIGLHLAALPALRGVEKSPSLASHLPRTGVGKLLVDKLNLASFRNSYGPRRSPGMRYFADLGEKPATVSDERVEFLSEEWNCVIQILERRDVNRDGIEDLVISFSETAIKGTLRSSDKYLVTRYTESGDLIALAYTP